MQAVGWASVTSIIAMGEAGRGASSPGNEGAGKSRSRAGAGQGWGGGKGRAVFCEKWPVVEEVGQWWRQAGLRLEFCLSLESPTAPRARCRAAGGL